jgi:uncharacterized protein
MPTPVDLTDVPVVDNHCHAVDRRQGHRDVEAWRAHFSESPDARMRSTDVADTVFYRRLMTEMAAHHGVPAREEAVLAARAELGAEELTGRLFKDARIGALVVDTGYPDPATALDGPRMAEAAGCTAVSLLRLELVLQDLVAAHERYDDLRDAVRDRLSDSRGKGFSGFKSVAGYRTGLDIRRWQRDEVDVAFAAARQEVRSRGMVRLGHKPLLDSLLHVAFEVAAAEELPVQFHVGYGDPDADLREANPLLLRAVLEERAYRGMPVVLLHGCWPFVREGAYLAAVYGNAHLDVSFGIPFLSRQEMRAVTRAALGAAPVSKLMYSSDGARVPELHWMAAHDGRRLLGQVLGELVDDGDLTSAQARTAGERILRDNAEKLYDIARDR